MNIVITHAYSFKQSFWFPGCQICPGQFLDTSDRTGDMKAWVRNILNGLRATRGATQKCTIALDWKQKLHSFE